MIDKLILIAQLTVNPITSTPPTATNWCTPVNNFTTNQLSCEQIQTTTICKQEIITIIGANNTSRSSWENVCKEWEVDSMGKLTGRNRLVNITQLKLL